MELVDGAPYVEDVKRLIREYVEWFGRDLSFQSLDEELDHIESKYLPPEGRLVVAMDDGGVVCHCTREKNTRAFAVASIVRLGHTLRFQADEMRL